MRDFDQLDSVGDRAPIVISRVSRTPKAILIRSSASSGNGNSRLRTIKTTPLAEEALRLDTVTPFKSAVTQKTAAGSEQDRLLPLLPFADEPQIDKPLLFLTSRESLIACERPPCANTDSLARSKQHHESTLAHD
jgi:hypothetical protein